VAQGAVTVQVPKLPTEKVLGDTSSAMNPTVEVPFCELNRPVYTPDEVRSM
jgi:hypothetical protein